MSNKSFIIRKLEWMEAVATDVHEWLPLALAVKLAARYFNNRSETAWPSVDRLAEELGTYPRNIRRAMDVLVDAGWLVRKRETSGGRSKSNRYHIRDAAAARKGGSRAPLYERGAHAPSWGAHAPFLGGLTRPPNQRRNQRREPERGFPPLTPILLRLVGRRNHLNPRRAKHLNLGRPRPSLKIGY